MIRSLTINPDKEQYYGRIKDKPFMNGKESVRIPFEPGLNFLVGDNGAGKSTILKYLALLTGTREYCGLKKADNFELHDQKKCKSVLDWDKDNPVRYFDPEEMPGLMMGQFVDTTLGLNSLMQRKQSKGQIVICRVGNMILDAVKEPEKAHKWTLILDEPDDGFTPGLSYNFWENIVHKFKDCQIIASSQSLTCLGIPEANYIQLSKNWLQNANQILELLALRVKVVKDIASKRANNNSSPF